MERNSEPCLVTGAAGFVGYHLIKALLKRGVAVYGVDNFDPYYDCHLKQMRVQQLQQDERFSFLSFDLNEAEHLLAYIQGKGITRVFHLAASVGVRDSAHRADEYRYNNVQATATLLQCLTQIAVEQLYFTSSSSVYDPSLNPPFHESNLGQTPASPYGKSKREAERIIQAFAQSTGTAVTILRPFTLYGPWGRPDMALMQFFHALRQGQEIQVHIDGNQTPLIRDFTYIDDFITLVMRLMDCEGEPSPTPAIYNMGSGRSISILEWINAIEQVMQKPASVRLIPAESCELRHTHADLSQLNARVPPWNPTDISRGITESYRWFQAFYGS